MSNSLAKLDPQSGPADAGSIAVGELSPDEVAELIALQAKVGAIDLDQLERERLARLSPRERVIRELEQQGAKKAMTRVKKRGPGRPKQHWKTKKRKHREYMRRYMAERYHEIGKPRRTAERKKCLENGDWFGYLLINWKHHQKVVRMNQHDWDRCVAPRLGESVPVVLRYNANEPISLYNIVVKDSDTRRVLFDGKEQQLVDSGYAVE